MTTALIQSFASLGSALGLLMQRCSTDPIALSDAAKALRSLAEQSPDLHQYARGYVDSDAVNALLETGMSIEKTALRLGISKSGVRNARRKAAESLPAALVVLSKAERLWAVVHRDGVSARKAADIFGLDTSEVYEMLAAEKLRIEEIERIRR